MKEKAELFLQNCGQACKNINAEEQINLFLEEMNKGLTDKSSLPMVPTYLQPSTDIVKNEKKILLDAGGTNFRSAVGYFDEDGVVEIHHLTKSQMLTARVSKEAFYDHIAKQIVPLADEGGDVGYCFSYNVAMDKDIDGTVVALSKELDNPSLVGTRVGQCTLDALKQYNQKERKICILNDTVATLLGGLAFRIGKKYSAHLGFIFGTGINVCYVENTENIHKVSDFEKEKMIINVESASYNKLPVGELDRIVMNNTAEPDRSPLEKMTSGKYFSDLAYQALFKASIDGLFTAKTNLKPFETKDVSCFLMDETNDLYRMFKNTADRTLAKFILKELVDRSAKISAISLTATAMKNHDGSNNPVCIVCEGTTFNKLTGYRDALERYLDLYFGERGMTYEIVREGQELNLVGSLLATFSL